MQRYYKTLAIAPITRRTRGVTTAAIIVRLHIANHTGLKALIAVGPITSRTLAVTTAAIIVRIQIANHRPRCGRSDHSPRSFHRNCCDHHRRRAYYCEPPDAAAQDLQIRSSSSSGILLRAARCSHARPADSLKTVSEFSWRAS